MVTTGRARLAGWVIDAGQIADVRVNGMPARLTTIAGQATRGISGIRPGPDSVAQEGPEPPPLAPGETAIRFQVDVNLAVGTNTLTVVATDASGHEAMVEHPVTRTAMIAEVGPIIRIEQPREWSGATRGFVARARESVEVRGTVRDPMGGAVREIRVNNELAAVQPEAGFVRFTGWAPVEMDTREVEIEAWTGDGRYSSEIFAVQPQPPAAPTGSDLFPGQRWAVVIGISDYADPGIRDLEYADDDALAVYEFFTSEAAGGGGIPVENTRLLLNDEATYRNVRTALFSFLERATEQDIVYVYLAGHGAPNPRRADELYILPYDAEVENLPGTALPMGDVTEAIRRLYAHHTVLITDACHSGGVSIGGFATRSGAGNAINQAFLMDLASTQAGLAILTASEAREESQEGSRWGGGHGVFTYYLLEGLRGAADTDPDGIVRWGELADYVRSQVARDTRNGQHPDTGSQSHDRFLPMAIVMGPPER